MLRPPRIPREPLQLGSSVRGRTKRRRNVLEKEVTRSAAEHQEERGRGRERPGDTGAAALESLREEGLTAATAST